MEGNIIINEAILQLKNHTGIHATWKKHTNPELDGKLYFHHNHHQYETNVEIKKEWRYHDLGPLLQQQQKHHPLMIIADYIVPRLKEELRNEGIGYLETTGNIYFRQKDYFLWLDGQKAAKKPTEKIGRAFTKTGLKIVFHFLLQPEWINLPYREIAQRTGVGFGNIHVVLTDLKEQGFIVPLNKTTDQLVNKKELLEKWITGYQEKLRPALLIGKFRFLNNNDQLNWKQMQLDKEVTWWGAEPAADLITNFLQPEVFTIYTTEHKGDLIRKYRLLPDEHGNVQVYQKFWHSVPGTDETVPPVLVYIDLLITGDRRSMQAAEKIKYELLPNQF